MTFAETTNVWALWLATIVLAGSAVVGLSKAVRRDRDGFLDRKVVWALPTVMFGAGVALTIMIVAHLMPFAPAGAAPGRSLVELAPTVWVWVAVVVVLVWLIASVFACVAIQAYQVQQRRLDAAGHEPSKGGRN